jgi:hypothetical protein
LLNWGCASLIVMGVLVQFLLERRGKRKPEPAEEPEPVAVAPPPPPQPKRARSSLWAWGERLIHRRAG